MEAVSFRKWLRWHEFGEPLTDHPWLAGPAEVWQISPQATCETDLPGQMPYLIHLLEGAHHLRACFSLRAIGRGLRGVRGSGWSVLSHAMRCSAIPLADRMRSVGLQPHLFEALALPLDLPDLADLPSDHELVDLSGALAMWWDMAPLDYELDDDMNQAEAAAMERVFALGGGVCQYAAVYGLGLRDQGRSPEEAIGRQLGRHGMRLAASAVHTIHVWFGGRLDDAAARAEVLPRLPRIDPPSVLTAQFARTLQELLAQAGDTVCLSAEQACDLLLPPPWACVPTTVYTERIAALSPQLRGRARTFLSRYASRCAAAQAGYQWRAFAIERAMAAFWADPSDERLAALAPKLDADALRERIALAWPEVPPPDLVEALPYPHSFWHDCNLRGLMAGHTRDSLLDDWRQRLGNSALAWLAPSLVWVAPSGIACWLPPLLFASLELPAQPAAFGLARAVVDWLLDWHVEALDDLTSAQRAVLHDYLVHLDQQAPAAFSDAGDVAWQDGLDRLASPSSQPNP